jgi:hypothetical protein
MGALVLKIVSQVKLQLLSAQHVSYSTLHEVHIAVSPKMAEC